MSAEARLQGQIADAVRTATEPLEKAVAELSARLDAVEGTDGTKSAEAPKRPARGRTAKAKTASDAQSAQAGAQTAEVTAVTGDGVRTERVPEQRKENDA